MDVLLLVELVFWNTQGAVRLAVETPALVTEKVDPPSVIVPAAEAPARLFSTYVVLEDSEDRVVAQEPAEVVTLPVKAGRAAQGREVALDRLMEVGVPSTEPLGIVTVPVNVGDAKGAAPKVL
jgi:hypothetical protein